MFRSNLTVLILGSSLALGCSSAYDLELPTDWNDKAALDLFAQKIEKLPDSEKADIGAYMIRRKLTESLGGLFGVPKPEGNTPKTTVRQALEDQKRFAEEKNKEDQAAKTKKAEENSRADAERQKLEAKVQAMASICTVRMVEKNFVPSDINAGRLEDKLTVTFELSNKGQKKLSGFKGTIELYDMFGEKLKDLHLAYDTGLNAGETKRWGGAIKYNQASSEDQRLAGAVLEKMTSKWVPEMIVLEDGTKISVDDPG
jgi:hypothetical protein